MKGNDNNKSKFLLTNREREVFELLVQDKTTKDIAQQLFISEKTVRNHISNVMWFEIHTKPLSGGGRGEGSSPSDRMPGQPCIAGIGSPGASQACNIVFFNFSVQGRSSYFQKGRSLA